MVQRPKCESLGPQCRSLHVTVLVDNFDPDDDTETLDHNATWLLGHTERVTFSNLRREDDELLVDAQLHVPCKYLEANGRLARCRAFHYRGPVPRAPTPRTQPRRLGGNRFRLVDHGELTEKVLPTPRRSLKVLQTNPCDGAPCRTADNTRGGACCRDLQMEILCRKGQTSLESLLRARKAPYLCKVDREGDASLTVEMISSCDYLEEEGVACSLHGRHREDGRSAKPQLCWDWPPRRGTVHPGCAFRGRGRADGPTPRRGR